MEAYKELFQHARNEEKRQTLLECFQQVWTQTNIFGRLRDGDIKWNLTPHREFLTAELGAWNTTPIRINMLSPSPDVEAEFLARPDLSAIIDEFIQGVSATCQQAAPHLSNTTPQAAMETDREDEPNSEPTPLSQSPPRSRLHQDWNLSHSAPTGSAT